MKLVLGVVYNPIFEELFSAGAGEKGAFFQRGRECSARRLRRLRGSLLCYGISETIRGHAHPNISLLLGFLRLCSHGVRRDGSGGSGSGVCGRRAVLMDFGSLG